MSTPDDAPEIAPSTACCTPSALSGAIEAVTSVITMLRADGATVDLDGAPISPATPWGIARYEAARSAVTTLVAAICGAPSIDAGRDPGSTAVFEIVGVHLAGPDSTVTLRPIAAARCLLGPCGPFFEAGALVAITVEPVEREGTKP